MKDWNMPDEVNPAYVTYTGHSRDVLDITWSPDSRYIASASKDATVQVWEALTGRHLLTYTGHTVQVFSVAWSPDGQHVASGGMDETLDIWEARTGIQVSTHKLISFVQSVAWSPDGNHLAAGSFRRVYLWQCPEQVLVATYYGHHGHALALAWSSDGRYLASADDDGHRFIWDVVTSRKVLTFRSLHEAAFALSWSPEGYFLASGGTSRVVEIRDVFGKKALTAYAGHTEHASHTTNIYDISWSPNGRYVASASGNAATPLFANSGTAPPILSNDNVVHVWEAASGQHLYTYQGHTSAVSSVQWAPNGRYIASGSWDKTVQIWPAPVV